MSKIAIAGLQLELDPNKDNLKQIEIEINQVMARFPWVDMVMLSELAAFGTSTENAIALPSDTEKYFQNIARRHSIWLIPGTFFEKSSEHIFNSAVVISPSGDIHHRQRKIFPFLPYEKNVSAGDSIATFDIPGVGRFGLCVCYDLWFPEVTRSLVWQGAEVVLIPTLTNTNDRDLEKNMAKSMAIMNQTYLFSLNGGMPMANGGSVAYGPEGEVVYQNNHGNKDQIIVQLDLEKVRQARERGVLGLGQPLKSLRDNETVFPCYGAKIQPSASWNDFGELKIPEPFLAKKN